MLKTTQPKTTPKTTKTTTNTTTTHSVKPNNPSPKTLHGLKTSNSNEKKFQINDPLYMKSAYALPEEHTTAQELHFRFLYPNNQ